MSARKNVNAATVRAWFAENTPANVPVPGSRGRLHPDTIAAFHKANRGLRYETASVAEQPHITVPGVVGIDKAGRKVTKAVTLTTAEAREALGHDSGKRGRFAMGDLALALSARNADEVASTFK